MMPYQVMEINYFLAWHVACCTTGDISNSDEIHPSIMHKKDMLHSIESAGFAVIEDFISRRTLDKFMHEVYRRFDRLSYNGTKGKSEG